MTLLLNNPDDPEDVAKAKAWEKEVSKMAITHDMRAW